MNHVIIKGMTIQEAWFRCIRACLALGEDYIIDKGEYEGQFRREFDLVTIQIQCPSTRPLACSTPSLTPTSGQRIKDYFRDYLLNSSLDDLEGKYNEYKYASWIEPAWAHCCELLANGQGGCNQATISLGKGAGDPSRFTHPPCLRLIDMRLKNDELHFFVYFRSWDLIAGMPENLGGLQLLKELCGEYIESLVGRPIYDGALVAMSKGLHIYDHFIDLAQNDVGDSSYLREASDEILANEGIYRIPFGVST